MKTLFLAADPSLLSGMARLWDFAGTFDEYNLSATDAEADARAMYADWYAVGESLRVAMSKVAEEQAR